MQILQAEGNTGTHCKKEEGREREMVSVRRKLLFSGGLGVIIGFCYVAGYSLDRWYSLDLTQKTFYGKWLLAALVGTGMVYGIFSLVERIGKTTGSSARASWISGFFHSRCCCMLLLFVCWLPALLSLFPGAFSYDAYSEWEQVAKGKITAHHPVIHVLLAGGSVEWFHDLTGSYNVGIAVYCIAQMIVLAGVLAAVVFFLQSFGLPRWLQVFAFLFYGLSPVIQLFSISVTKDVLFTAALMIFYLYVIRFYCRRENFVTGLKNWILWGASSFFSIILRNNGLYVVVFTLLGITVEEIWRRKTLQKRLLAMLAVVAALYGLYTGPFYSLLEVVPGGIEEMLSVPLQQMARVYKYEYDSLEQQDLELLYQVVPKEKLELYRSTVSDFVKQGFDRQGFDENRKEIIQLWIKWSEQYPLVYLNSFLLGTVDFWYPNAVVDGYQDVYGKSSFFDYRVEKPGTEMVILPAVHKYYETLSWDKDAQKIPFAFLFLSPGWYIMMWLVISGYLWCYKKYTLLLTMLLFFMLLVTVFLGPVALVRYVLVFYTAFPVLLGVFLYSDLFVENIKMQQKGKDCVETL